MVRFSGHWRLGQGSKRFVATFPSRHYSSANEFQAGIS